MAFPVSCYPKSSRPGNGGGAAAFVGALDDYTANLSAAWSVARRLLGSYSGALMRVRRSSDDAEQDIGADSFGLLDEGALQSFMGSDSAYVTTVYHQNGGSDLVQTTAAYQPRIANAGTIDYANSPAMKFDGTDDCLTCAAVNLDEMAWYVAAKTGASTANFLGVISQPAQVTWGGDYSRVSLQTFLTGWYQNVESLTYNTNTWGSYGTNATKLLELHNISGTGNFGVDNGTETSAAGAPATVTDSTQPFCVGVTHPDNIGIWNWNGYIGEILGWGAGYDSTARAARRAAMNDFWVLY